MEKDQIKIIDVPIGQGLELIVDETAGTLTIELKGTILGQPQDIKIPISLIQIITGLEASITNPFVKWALGLILALL